MAEILPVAPFKRLLKSSGRRVSEDAADALAEVIEELGYLVVEEAATVAAENKRKTIRPEDVKEAMRRLW